MLQGEQIPNGIDWFARIVALWGAIIATGVALFELYKWKRHGKPKLKLL